MNTIRDKNGHILEEHDIVTYYECTGFWQIEWDYHGWVLLGIGEHHTKWIREWHDCFTYYSRKGKKGESDTRWNET